MLYSELYDRTNGHCTLDEYEVINAAYMEAIGTSAEMDKDDAASLWNSVYGKKWEDKEKAYHKAVHTLITGIVNNDGDILFENWDETQAVLKEVIGYFKLDILPFTLKKINRFTDKHGVEWSITRNDKADWKSEEFSLYIISKGKKVFVRNFAGNN